MSATDTPPIICRNCGRAIIYTADDGVGWHHVRPDTTPRAAIPCHTLEAAPLDGWEEHRTVDDILTAWRALKLTQGYRTAGPRTPGWPTLEDELERQDVYVHNLSISLRLAVDTAGRNTPAGIAVSELWHDIVANALAGRNMIRHLIELRDAS